MQLQKTSGNVTVPETPSKASAAQAAKPAASAVSKMPPSAPQTRSVSSLILAAGLPQDKLSASIVSFARFFSQPLKPEILKHIRQQAFSMTPNAPPTAAGDDAAEAGTVFKNREALSLAASAAEGKGVELHTKSLETYAQAIDPESRRHGEQGDKRGKRDKNNDDNDKDSEVSSPKNIAMSAASLEKTALERAEMDPLLAILNRLPGKDGKRWIVLPFDFSDNGREFRVSLRILLETGRNINRAACMALDIAVRSTIENGGTEERRLFILEPANRLSVYLRPVLTPAQQTELVRDLSALLEIAPERVFIKTQTESFPFEGGCEDGLLGPIDEAV